MADKIFKCCCGKPCEGHCLTIGSLFPQCTVCSESPFRFNLGYLGTPPFFTCCPELGFQPTLGKLTGDPTAPTCVWKSDVVVCSASITAQWSLLIISTLPGGVVLQIDWSDGRHAAWTNLSAWQCLCRNIMVRDHTRDYGYVDCTLPPEICVIPLDPCCGSRIQPLPRTLYATLTDAGNCACIKGTIIPLYWNPILDKWIGSGPYGTCVGATFTIRISCSNTILDLTDWQGDVQWKGGNSFCPDTGQEVIGTGFIGQFTIVNCDPVHLRFGITQTGNTCCGFIFGSSKVSVDITE